jgi:hypothetical protein
MASQYLATLSDAFFVHRTDTSETIEAKTEEIPGQRLKNGAPCGN